GCRIASATSADRVHAHLRTALLRTMNAFTGMSDCSGLLVQDLLRPLHEYGIDHLVRRCHPSDAAVAERPLLEAHEVVAADAAVRRLERPADVRERRGILAQDLADERQVACGPALRQQPVRLEVGGDEAGAGFAVAMEQPLAEEQNG